MRTARSANLCKQFNPATRGVRPERPPDRAAVFVWARRGSMIMRGARQPEIKTPFSCARLIVRLCLERRRLPDKVLQRSVLPAAAADAGKRIFEKDIELTLRFYTGCRRPGVFHCLARSAEGPRCRRADDRCDFKRQGGDSCIGAVTSSTSTRMAISSIQHTTSSNCESSGSTAARSMARI